MKMGIAQMCGFLAMSVLLFILLVDSTAADDTEPTVADLKKGYCEREIIIKGTYPDIYRIKIPPIHDFIINQVFKSPQKMGKNIKINKIGNKFCDYRPDEVKGKEFIITGNRRISQVICYASRKWSRLSPVAKEALNQISRNGCK